MEVQDIPQDAENSSYQGHQKVIYATRGGHFEAATSLGWEDETYATEQAGEQLHHLAAAALAAVARGEKSPLYYLMYAYRHDETSLAQAAGVFRWQLRRHFRPSVWAKLGDKTLAKYAEAFQLPIAALNDTAAAARFAPEAVEAAP